MFLVGQEGLIYMAVGPGGSVTLGISELRGGSGGFSVAYDGKGSSIVGALCLHQLHLKYNH